MIHIVFSAIALFLGQFRHIGQFVLADEFADAGPDPILSEDLLDGPDIR